MNITEKLGIKPIRGFNVYTDDVDNGGGRCCYESEVRKVEQQNADMLELLVEEAKEHFNTSKEYGERFRLHSRYKDYLYLTIEMAMIFGINNDEIKQLIGE